MGELTELSLRAVVIGIGATLIFDGWLVLQRLIGLPMMNFAALGRWIGHIARGTWTHDSIATATPIRRELAIGWVTHYAIGIVFAVLLLMVSGQDWHRDPTFGVALAVGVATVIAPLFVLQPAMGAGIASSKTATPLKNCARSLLNHVVFGIALYTAASVVAAVAG